VQALRFSRVQYPLRGQMSKNAKPDRVIAEVTLARRIRLDGIYGLQKW
jgi:hypothetical protein